MMRWCKMTLSTRMLLIISLGYLQHPTLLVPFHDPLVQFKLCMWRRNDLGLKISTVSAMFNYIFADDWLKGLAPRLYRVQGATWSGVSCPSVLVPIHQPPHMDRHQPRHLNWQHDVVQPTRDCLSSGSKPGEACFKFHSQGSLSRRSNTKDVMRSIPNLHDRTPCRSRVM